MMLHFAQVRRAGFTLIEIMIVIAIIGILAGVAVPNIAMARFEAKLTVCLKNCETGMRALQMARIRYTLEEVADILGGGCYSDGLCISGGDLDRLVDLGYLERPLRCPALGSGWSGGYGVDYYPASTGYYIDYFYRDWQCTQNIPVYAPYCDVYSRDYHYFGDKRAWPVYEENAGPGFWK